MITKKIFNKLENKKGVKNQAYGKGRTGCQWGPKAPML